MPILDPHQQLTPLSTLPNEKLPLCAEEQKKAVPSFSRDVIQGNISFPVAIGNPIREADRLRRDHVHKALKTEVNLVLSSVLSLLVSNLSKFDHAFYRNLQVLFLLDN